MAQVAPVPEVRHHRFEVAELDALDTVLAAQAGERFGLIRIVPVGRGVRGGGVRAARAR